MPSNPKESHLTFVKRIIRYISETLDYGLGILFIPLLLLSGILMSVRLKT